MHLLRIIADAQCRHNFDIVASHVSREFNELTDCLSRWQVPGDITPVPSSRSVATPLAQVTRAYGRTPSVPDAVSSQLRASLQSAVAITEQLRVASSTAAGYSSKVRQFYKFCSVVGLESVYNLHTFVK